MKKNRVIVRKPIERIEPDFNTGLSDNDVSIRVENGYQNKVVNKNDKTIRQIVVHNVFTFFNSILMLIALTFLIFIIYLYASGNAAVVNKHFGFSKFGFLIPAFMNIVIGTIQEIHGKKVLDKLKIVTEAKTRVIRNGKEIQINASDVVIDDIVLLKAGEQATADFRVVDGFISVDESMLTGEADYIKKMPGDVVYSGSSIIVGDAKVIVTEVGDKTYAANLSNTVKGIEKTKSELMTNIINTMKILSIILGVVAITIIITMIYKINAHGWDENTWDGMQLSISNPVTWARIMITVGSFSVGIIPSGLVLTTSVTLALSIVSLSKKNTLIQELYSLENLSRVDVICLDKTGTLTDGTFNVKDINIIDKKYKKDEIIDILIKGESLSNHPIAKSILELTDKKIDNSDVLEFREIEGKGISFKLNNKKIIIGNKSLCDCIHDATLHLNIDGSHVASITISDGIKENTKKTIDELKKRNIKTYMFTGDKKDIAIEIGEKLGIDSLKYEMLPTDKYHFFEEVRENDGITIFVGDGINDAPTLKRADIGISMGGVGSDSAIEASDIVLMKDDLIKISQAIDISFYTKKIIKQNLLFAIMVKLIILILSVLGLANMWLAVFADTGVTLITILNTLRIIKKFNK